MGFCRIRILFDRKLAFLERDVFSSNRMLKKFASGVLASFRDSEELEDILRSPRSILGANGHTKCGWYLLASSLAAALLDGLFEHPAAILKSVPYGIFQWWFMNKPSFPTAC